jgi:hypothetical protein
MVRFIFWGVISSLPAIGKSTWPSWKQGGRAHRYLIVTLAMMAILIIPATRPAQGRTVSHAVGSALSSALRAERSNDWALAHAYLRKARLIPNATATDKYTINEIAGFVAIKQKDYPAAAKAYQAMAASPVLETLGVQQRKQALGNALMLSAEVHNWKQVVFAAQKLRRIAPLGLKAQTNLAVAYQNLHEGRRAKEAARKSIKLAKSSGRTPYAVAWKLAGKAGSPRQVRSLGASQAALCNLVNRQRRELAQLRAQANHTSNPLRRAGAQSRYNAFRNNASVPVANFLLAHPPRNYSGRVSSFTFHQYFEGPAVRVSVELGCNASFNLLFINDRTGQQKDETSLAAYRGMLENLKVGDTVTFSGRYYFQYGARSVRVSNDAPLVLYGKAMAFRIGAR